MKSRTAEARRMLDLWKSEYLEVRAKIEASGRDSRWEFDRKRLFDRTSYMASICKDLHDIAQVSRLAGVVWCHLGVTVAAKDC